MDLARRYLRAAGGVWSAESLALFVGAAQARHTLLLAEVLLLPEALRLAQLEYILDRADEAFAAGEMVRIEASPFSAPLHSMRRLNQFEWRELLEAMIPFDGLLREDPEGVFAEMEDETRRAYYMRVAELAADADASEVETAGTALALAREAEARGDRDPRRAQRLRHVGYYLVAEGGEELKKRIGYHAQPAERMRNFVRRYNDDFYVFGIILLSMLMIAVIVAPLVPRHNLLAVLGAMLLALLPATQGAVDLVNGMVTGLLKAEALPKCDFAKGVPVDATTLVVVPTLLLTEKQVEELFEDLEARYLANEDANVHFGLLTDLPDARVQPPPDEAHPLVMMAIRYTEDLNAKYGRGRGGKFLLLHRHRVWNAKQGAVDGLGA